MTIQTVIIIFVVLVIIMVGVTVIDSNRFVVREYTVETDKVKNSHDFLFVSDLHSRMFGKDNRRLFAAIDKLDVEGTFIAGDLMTATPGFDNHAAVEFLRHICDKMPVYYSEGNHELRAKLYPEDYGTMYEDYTKELDSIPVRILDNEKVCLDDLDIYALSISRKYYIRTKKVKMADDYVEKKVGKNNRERFSILLAHDPEYFPTYSKFDPDVVLSGHFHGGMARIPGFKGVISPRFKLFPKYDGGLYREGNSLMILNRGLGAHSIIMRPFNPGELIVIHIKKL